LRSLELAEIWAGRTPSAAAAFAQGKGRKEGRDAEFLGEFQHPAPGPVLDHQTPQDHGRLAAQQGHLEHRLAAGVLQTSSR